MSSEVERLLVNGLFILLPIFIFQMFWVDRNRIKPNLKMPAFVTMLSLSAILCMSFPIEFSTGFLFDLRQVPFIIGALYGGYFFSIPIYAAMLGYWFLFGGEGIQISVTVLTLIAVFVPLLSGKFLRLNMDKRILFAITTALSTAILTVILANFFWQIPLNSENIPFYYFIAQGLTIWIGVYLIETMVGNFHMRKELIKVEKMSIISQISASISHEVKNPITITQGFVEALVDEDSQEKRQEYAGYALDELKRAQNIIQGFLQLTKPEPETLANINISDELLYITNLLKPYAKSHFVTIDIVGTDEEYYILGDSHKVRQCFINLIKNAIEAMENGGKLRLLLEKDGDKLFIHIIDNGIGMTSHELENLANPYFTTKEKGTGLGMMIVFKIIKNLKGDIKVKSQKGKGTHFTITFPLICQKQIQSDTRILPLQ